MAGGVAGASLRWAASQPLELDREAFQWDELAVNLLGCLLIGVAAARMARGSIGWSFAVTGVLGGFTTMSGFALSTNDLLAADRAGAAIGYFLFTMVGGVTALLVGRRLAT